MGRAITFTGLEEGEIFCKWLHSRLINHNKNVLGAELGATGSGKSYRDLRKAELWYKKHFKSTFPIEHICFGISEPMKLISSGKLRRGDIIIFEEAGVNLGSRDWQGKLSKMFNYVLQSFRSMNIGIFFNVPYLSMLDNQARHLLHYSSESAGIDFQTKQNKCKFFLHQVNQSSGKIYKKYPIVKVNGKTRQIKRLNYSLPSQYLIDAYEKKKKEYISSITSKFNEQIIEIQNKEKGGVNLSWIQKEIFRLMTEEKLKVKETAKKLGLSIQKTYKHLSYLSEIGQNPTIFLEKQQK